MIDGVDGWWNESSGRDWAVELLWRLKGLLGRERRCIAEVRELRSRYGLPAPGADAPTSPPGATVAGEFPGDYWGVVEQITTSLRLSETEILESDKWEEEGRSQEYIIRFRAALAQMIGHREFDEIKEIETGLEWRIHRIPIVDVECRNLIAQVDAKASSGQEAGAERKKSRRGRRDGPYEKVLTDEEESEVCGWYDSMRTDEANPPEGRHYVKPGNVLCVSLTHALRAKIKREFKKSVGDTTVRRCVDNHLAR